ncbi:MAG: M15 family metallopeptidase, partial [bacterium]
KPATATNDDMTSRLGGAAIGLDRTLQSKIATVIARMRDEYGRTVTVGEGVRSQARQDVLYAQGRTTTGPVVTWTRNSLHGKGLAADLVVDGGYDDRAGFDLLRKVAEEEGLHTLGKMDPGHVELRDARSSRADAAAGLTSLAVGLPAKAPMSALDLATKAVASMRDVMAAPDTMARVNASTLAPVARVANVAATARVASVASVAHPMASAAVTPQEARGSSGNANQSDTRDQRGGAKSHAAPAFAPVTGVDGSAGERTYASMSRPIVLASGGDMTPVAAAAGSSSAAHVERIAGIQDNQGARSLSRLAIALEDGNGGEDVIRIGVRGSRVGASFDMRDAGGVDRVNARLGELTQALARRGLEPQAFQVRTTATTQDVASTLMRDGGLVQRTDATPNQQNAQSGTRDDNRQRDGQQNQSQERARDRSDDRRRRDATFSLTNEES